MKCRVCHRNKTDLVITKQGKIICTYCNNRRSQRRRYRIKKKIDRIKGSTNSSLSK